MANAPRLTLDNGNELDRLSLQPRKASGDADWAAKSVGQDLRKARQHRGKELSDVWLALKIRPDYLIAMEEGRFEVLPGRVYAIGYVRSYAAYLGLDAENCVGRLKAEIAAPGGAQDPAIDVSPLPEYKLPQSRTFIAGLLLVAVIYSGYYAFASAGRTFEQPVTPVPERLVAEAGLAQKPVAEPRLATVEQAASILPPEPTVPIPTEIAPTPPVSISVEPAPKVQAPLPPGRRYGARNKNSRITLRVHRPTRVAVQGARNRTFIDRTLGAGDTYRVPNAVGLRLNAPDAGAVEVILDGSSLGFAGDDGVTAKGLSLNPQNIIDRQRRG